MGTTLTIKTGSEQREIACTPVVAVGRGSKNDIILADDRKASRQHALIRLMGDGRYYLTDMGSSNGTFVNEMRLLIPHRLRDKDLIGVGNTSIVFNTDATEDDAEQTIDTQAGSTEVGLSCSIQLVTTLVVDIRNYTSLSEKVEVRHLATVMSRTFRAMTEAVELHNGVVDKFIGDAVMARWTAPDEGARETVVSAMKTVIGICDEMQKLNAHFKDLPLPLRCGAGINSGQAVVGSIGSRSQMEHTALGDAVNVAFRLESASKELGKDVVLGPGSFRALPEQWWSNELASIKVKGKDEPIEVWALKFDNLRSLLAGK